MGAVNVTGHDRKKMSVVNELHAVRPSGDPETLTVTSIRAAIPLAPDGTRPFGDDAVPVEVFIGGYRLIVDGHELVAAAQNAMNTGNAPR